MKLVAAGYFSRTHGIKGELVLKASEIFNPKVKVIYMKQKGSEAPYFIDVLRPFKNDFLIKLEGVDYLSSSEKLKNKEIFIEEKSAKKIAEFKYLNYVLFDEDKKRIGVITGLDKAGQTSWLLVNCNEKEILLPYHKDLIIKTEKEKKQIIYRIPEGLLDL